MSIDKSLLRKIIKEAILSESNLTIVDLEDYSRASGEMTAVIKSDVDRVKISFGKSMSLSLSKDSALKLGSAILEVAEKTAI